MSQRARRAPWKGTSAQRGHLPDGAVQEEDQPCLANSIEVRGTAKTADRLGRCSKDDFGVGDRVLCKDMKTMMWSINGEVIESREAEDGLVRSFIIRTEMGRTTLRNSRHIKFQA